MALLRFKNGPRAAIPCWSLRGEGGCPGTRTLVARDVSAARYASSQPARPDAAIVTAPGPHLGDDADRLAASAPYGRLRAYDDRAVHTQDAQIEIWISLSRAEHRPQGPQRTVFGCRPPTHATLSCTIRGKTGIAKGGRLFAAFIKRRRWATVVIFCFWGRSSACLPRHGPLGRRLSVGSLSRRRTAVHCRALLRSDRSSDVCLWPLHLAGDHSRRHPSKKTAGAIPQAWFSRWYASLRWGSNFRRPCTRHPVFLWEPFPFQPAR
jgi:hypothetical protein